VHKKGYRLVLHDLRQKLTAWSGGAAMLLLAATALLSCAGSRRALPSAAPARNGFSETELARIAPALQAYVDSGKLAGIYAVIARRGSISYERTFGWRDRERRIPMRRDAVFRIFSMTKPVVAVGALKLVDQGKLALDDPVAKYIPAFANIRVYTGGSAESPIAEPSDSVITLRHLLTHTSGLGYGLTSAPADTIFARAGLYNPASTLAQFADSVARLPLLFTPGTRWAYSSALEIVGRIIEVASGQSLDDFLAAEIFRPLEMHNTTFRMRADLARKAAVLYRRGQLGQLEIVTGGLLRMYEPDARFIWASGGLLSTPDDYLRFAQMLLNGGELNGKRVLSTQSVAELTRNHLSPQLVPAAGTTMIDAGYGYGLMGSVLVDSVAAELPGAAGIYRWSGYVGTYFWVDPRNQLIAMVWTQFSPGAAYRLEDDFQKLVYAALTGRN
jgi:CubicO group peptidase (beta-lactamase class C family)